MENCRKGVGTQDVYDSKMDWLQQFRDIGATNVLESIKLLTSRGGCFRGWGGGRNEPRMCMKIKETVLERTQTNPVTSYVKQNKSTCADRVWNVFENKGLAFHPQPWA